MELGTAALNYAELGYRVFPCVPNTKTPATEHGLLDASSDPAQIEAWWREMPNANIGIVTEGLLVVDVDGKDNPWLRQIDARSLAGGGIQRTPRGGLHYVLRQNGTALRNTASRIAPMVDTRANGGYIVAAPSVIDGVSYTWLEPLPSPSELPVVPRWIVDGVFVRVSLAESELEVIPEGGRNHAMMRFAGLFRRGGLGSNEIFHALLPLNLGRCKPPLEDEEVLAIAESAARYEPDVVEVSLIHSHLFTPEPDPADALASPAFPQDALDTMPPLMRLAFDYTISTAVKPQPELTLAALIALFGVIFGRKVRDDYGTRTNIMVLGLAPSGAGKEHPRQINKQILFHAGLDNLSGPERIASHAGIISSLVEHPARLFQIDEIGRLLQTMRDPGKSPHLFNIGTVLMQLFSSSGTIWHGDAYADINKVKRINQPCVCVYGTSTLEGFYSGLTPDNLQDGLLARLIVLQVEGYGKRKRPGGMGVPFELLAEIKRWHEAAPGNMAIQNPSPLLVQKTADAEKRHEAYCEVVHEKHKDESNVAAAIWARAPEKEAKLALIHACCSVAPGHDPLITKESVDWAIKLVNYSTRLVLEGAGNTVARSHYESEKKRVWRSIQDGMTVNQLTRRTQWLRVRERQEILDDLKSGGAIEIVTEASGTVGGRPKLKIRKLRGQL